MAYDPTFDPQNCTTLSRVYASAASWQKIPGVKEPELKINVTDPSNFAGVFSYLVAHPDTHVSERINPVDYFLLSLSVDTLDRKFHDEDLQLRARGNLTADYGETFGQFDVCVKTLLSSTDIRDEVESCEGEIDCVENYYSQFIEAKRSCPVKQKELRALPAQLHDIHDIDLFVEAVCATSRSIFYMTLEIEEGVYAHIEATTDQNVFLTPHTDMVAGEDCEMEFEIKKIGSPRVMSDEEINAFTEAAMAKLQGIIEGEFPDVSVNEKSKIERATDSVMQVYRERNKNMQPVRDLRELGQIAARQWPVFQKVTVSEVLEEDNHLPLWELVSAHLRPAEELLQPLYQNDIAASYNEEGRDLLPFTKRAIA